MPYCVHRKKIGANKTVADTLIKILHLRATNKHTVKPHNGI